MSSLLRFKMVDAAINHTAVEVKVPEGRPSDYFGKKVFGRAAMRKYLDKRTYAALLDTMEKRTPLTREVADSIAAGMRQWALEHGADHYTHWFQPLTGGTAEKHDAFAEPDGQGGVLEEFSGKLLVQQEPDASSFPNGGIRNTFEARGYSAWDPTSPAFIVDTTLCIPTVFIAYTGEALDYKVPLLRSLTAIDKAATEVCRYFDKNVEKVFSYLGWEQEYFLVDESLWAVRPDLMLTGRTLMGHESAKNQQLEDHYFGAIPTRVMAFMKDLEYECLKLGIPVKTRHNEVAPNQFELAPVYEEANLANDHNQLLMTIMDKIARRHQFRVLLHEKPFKGINGSGKHNNWSLGTDTGVNLLGPGKTASENLQFITFLVNAISAVYKHNGLLKASIMSATNAHRLGANEAPPAIISTSYSLKTNEKEEGRYVAKKFTDNLYSINIGIEIQRTDEENRMARSLNRDLFKPSFFVSGAIGFSVPIQMKRYEPKRYFDYMATISAGRIFTPLSSLRLAADYGPLSTDRKGKTLEYDMASGSLDYMLNLTNLMTGYDPERKYDVQLFAGIVASMRMKHENRFFIGGEAGLQTSYRVGRRFKVFLEPKIRIYGKELLIQDNVQGSDIMMSLNAGTSFSF